jgi:hypothetical protein
MSGRTVPVKGIDIAYVAAGGVILFSGIKGATLTATVKGLLSGNLSSITPNEPIPVNNGSSSSATPTSSPVVGGDASQTQWIDSLLTALGAPTTGPNVNSIVNWMAHEEPTSDWNHANNPMNTTENEPGATAINGVGVKQYSSLTEGLDATVTTLENGNYGDILLQLRAGNGLTSGAEKGLSTWSGGAYTSV